MAKHFAVTGLRPLLTGVIPAVIEFPAPMDCQLNRLFARITNPNTNGDVILDINVNGVSIYGSPVDQPRIASGDTSVVELPVADLLEGDMVTVDIDAVPLGGVTGFYVIVQLQDAPTVQQYVKSVYRGALERQPTGPELSAAVASLTGACPGGTTLVATRAFLEGVFTGAEYLALTTTDDQYVEDMYNAVLDRQSDPGGFTFWTGFLAGSTRSVVLDNFNGCIEHQQLRVQPWCPSMPLQASATKLQGRDLVSTAPSTSQVIQWNGSSWVPATLDILASAFDFKASARAATTGALAAYTSASGVLTANANGALATQDGVTLAVTESLFVKNESGGNQKYNGIYVVTQVGDASHPFILTRRADANTSAKVTAGMMVPIEEGTAHGDQVWWLTTNNPITLDTTALTFSQIGALPTGAAGGDLTGNYPNPTLIATGPGAGTYGGSGGNFVESVQIDSKGRIIAIGLNVPSGGGGGGFDLVSMVLMPSADTCVFAGNAFMRFSSGSADKGGYSENLYTIGAKIAFRFSGQALNTARSTTVGFSPGTTIDSTHPEFGLTIRQTGTSKNQGTGSQDIGFPITSVTGEDLFEIEITATDFKCYQNGSLIATCASTPSGNYHFAVRERTGNNASTPIIIYNIVQVA